MTLDTGNVLQQKAADAFDALTEKMPEKTEHKLAWLRTIIDTIRQRCAAKMEAIYNDYLPTKYNLTSPEPKKALVDEVNDDLTRVGSDLCHKGDIVGLYSYKSSGTKNGWFETITRRIKPRKMETSSQITHFLPLNFVDSISERTTRGESWASHAESTKSRETILDGI